MLNLFKALAWVVGEIGYLLLVVLVVALLAHHMGVR